MLPHLNPSHCLKLPPHTPTLTFHHLHTKYIAPQLHNYYASHFLMLFEGKSNQARGRYKQYMYAWECCEHLQRYYQWTEITQHISPTVLKNTKEHIYFYFDVDIGSGQILMSHVEDPFRVKMQKSLAKNVLTGGEATTADKLSVGHKKKVNINQICKSTSRSEGSMKSILDLRECIDMMTKKFRHQNIVVNYYIDNSKKKQERKKGERNPHFLKREIEKEKISIILKREKSKFHGSEKQFIKNLDNYGLKNIKQGKGKNSNKAHSGKKNLCSKKKQQKIAKQPLTPAPRYIHPSSQQKIEVNLPHKCLHQKKSLRKQHLLNALSSKKDNKLTRSKIKSLSPKA